MEALEVLRAEFPQLTVWDPFPTLCPGAYCSAFSHDRPLFFDGDHLSGYGNEVLYPEFRRALSAAWPGSLSPRREARRAAARELAYKR